MASTNARGAYYRQRTKKWLEERGFAVAVLEQSTMVAPGVFTRRDQLGADLLAVSGSAVLFVQVKFGGPSWRKRGLSEAKKAFEPWPVPANSEQWIAVWELGGHEPLVYSRAHGWKVWVEPPTERQLPLGRKRK